MGMLEWAQREIDIACKKKKIRIGNLGNFKFDKEEPEEIDIYEYLERKSRYEERNKGLD